MTLKRLLKMTALVCLAALIGMIQIGSGQAAVRDRLDLSVGCTGFTSRGGGMIFERDNTGQGREQIVITATDGNGNVIYGPQTESSFLGSSLYINSGVFFPYSAAPTANPILVSVVSPAGNTFADPQTIYSVLGNCVALSSEFVPFLTSLPENPDGTVSPTVPLNAYPPRVTNPDGIGATLPGFLVVNTASLNIRSGDGPEYTVVGRVYGGTELIALGRNADRSWWYVQVGEVRGWVNNSLVVVRGDLRAAPEVPVLGEILQPSFFLYLATPLRLGPAEGAAVYCVLEGELEYFITGKTADGTWFRLDAMCGGVPVAGWVGADFGAIRNSGSLPIPVVDS